MSSDCDSTSASTPARFGLWSKRGIAPGEEGGKLLGGQSASGERLNDYDDICY